MDKPDIVEYELEEYLEKFHRYNKIMEDFLIFEFYKKEDRYKFKEISENLDPKNKKQVKEFFDLSSKFSEQIIFYPQSFRTSFLTQIFTILEHNLTDLCEYHHFTYKTDFSIKDLKGSSDTEKCKLYLTKTCKIDFKKLDPEWNFIENIRKIRNVFVHYKGVITSKHRHWKTIFQFVNSNKELIGFSEYIEYMSKSDFEEFHNEDSPYHLEIEARDLNEKLLNNIKSFFEKLKNEISFT